MSIASSKTKRVVLIVDYVGIASALKEAMNDYTARDRKNYGDTDVAKVAYPKFQEKLSVAVICSMVMTILTLFMAAISPARELSVVR